MACLPRPSVPLLGACGACLPVGILRRLSIGEPLWGWRAFRDNINGDDNRLFYKRYDFTQTGYGFNQSAFGRIPDIRLDAPIYSIIPLDELNALRAAINLGPSARRLTITREPNRQEFVFYDVGGAPLLRQVITLSDRTVWAEFKGAVQRMRDIGLINGAPSTNLNADARWIVQGQSLRLPEEQENVLQTVPIANDGFYPIDRPGTLGSTAHAFASAVGWYNVFSFFTVIRQLFPGPTYFCAPNLGPPELNAQGIELYPDDSIDFVNTISFTTRSATPLPNPCP